MADYIHGAYSNIKSVGTVKSDIAKNAIVYVGTAPVHTVRGGEKNLNVPVVVENIAQARALFGYSDDWSKYTLCEAMKVHLIDKGVGPIILINVLDVETFSGCRGEDGTTSAKANNGKIILNDAEDIIVDTIQILNKVRYEDYSITYDWNTKTIILQELTEDAFGDSELTINYSTVDATKITDEAVIGSIGDLNDVGIGAISKVYTHTGYIPSFLCVPRFGSHKAVHDAMTNFTNKVNGHWDVYMLVDMPENSGAKAIGYDEAAKYKKILGFDKQNETVYYPTVRGVDGKMYHLSVLAAANLQEKMLNHDGIPYESASNTEISIVQSLFNVTNNAKAVFDDSLVNKHLNKHGIASAAFVGGRWVIWGAHSADYDVDNADHINVAETARMMLYYIGNDFQARRALDVDKPLSMNMIQSIVSEEQARLDALVKIGALTYGKVDVEANAVPNSDIANGDLTFVFNITTTPLAKSLTAVVQWTDAGLSMYYQ